MDVQLFNWDRTKTFSQHNSSFRFLLLNGPLFPGVNLAFIELYPTSSKTRVNSGFYRFEQHFRHFSSSVIQLENVLIEQITPKQS